MAMAECNACLELPQHVDVTICLGITGGFYIQRWFMSVPQRHSLAVPVNHNHPGYPPQVDIAAHDQQHGGVQPGVAACHPPRASVP